MEQFWGLLTVYIEKLHSLELLIIEELESSYEHTMNNQAMSSVSEQLIQPAAGECYFSSCLALFYFNSSCWMRRMK